MIAVKKKRPSMLPPGSFEKISVMARKIREGPAAISEPDPTTVGMTTKPAVSATAVSQTVTIIESFRIFALSFTLAPNVTKIAHPIPTENITCIHASANVFQVNLEKSGSR